MGTITFKVHPITPTSPRIHSCNHIWKHFLSFCFWFYFACFSFKYIIHGLIRERRNTQWYLTFQFCNHWHHTFTLPKHTDVIHDWRAIVVRWLFMPFSQDCLVFPVKKSDTSVKYKRQLNLTHHKQEPQSSLA